MAEGSPVDFSYLCHGLSGIPYGVRYSAAKTFLSASECYNEGGAK